MCVCVVLSIIHQCNTKTYISPLQETDSMYSVFSGKERKRHTYI